MTMSETVYAARIDDAVALQALEVLGSKGQRQKVHILARDAQFPQGCVALIGVPKRSCAGSPSWYARVAYVRPAVQIVSGIESSSPERASLFIEVREPQSGKPRDFRKGVKQARKQVERIARRRERLR